MKIVHNINAIFNEVKEGEMDYSVLLPKLDRFEMLIVNFIVKELKGKTSDKLPPKQKTKLPDAFKGRIEFKLRGSKLKFDDFYKKLQSLVGKGHIKKRRGILLTQAFSINALTDPQYKKFKEGPKNPFFWVDICHDRVKEDEIVRLVTVYRPEGINQDEYLQLWGKKQPKVTKAQQKAFDLALAKAGY